MMSATPSHQRPARPAPHAAAGPAGSGGERDRSASSIAATHLPVMLDEVMAALEPIAGGTFVDATFGAGGYTRALLARGAARVVAVDRDPQAVAAARALAAESGGRVLPAAGGFAELSTLVADALGPDVRVEGVVFDLGVSSLQLDQAARGFSFRRAGPLDMRMGAEGPTAHDLVNRASEADLAAILRHFGDERAARRIARAIVAARSRAPIETTTELADLIAGCLPPPRPGGIHPATRSFQALRIAVNDELGQLVRALAAAEAVLAPGGRLVVVSFHSLEDRIVKHFLRAAAGGAGRSRHLPEAPVQRATFEAAGRAVTPSAAEVAANPRARSARLRRALRTAAPPRPATAITAELAPLLPPAPTAAQALRGRRP